MVNGQGRKIAFIVALLACAVCGWYGYRSWVVLAAKAAEQDAATETVARWKASYLALADSRAKWDRDYRQEASVQDIASLFSFTTLDHYGLVSDTDTLILTKVDQVASGGAAIGLTKICMATGTGDGQSLVVQAPSYQALLEGVEKLAKRPDIFIGNIIVRGDGGSPVAKLGDFCVLLRND